MSEAVTIRVYMVDDHPVVRAGVCAMLEDCPEIQVVGGANEAATALREIPILQPNMVLLDLRLPGQDGCSLCYQLKQLAHPPRVLVLTSYGDDDSVLAAVGSGADGFLLKDSRNDMLVAAIRMVAAGGTVWPAAVTKSLRQTMQPAPEKPKTPFDTLSQQEMRILALIADGKTNKEIGADLGVAEKTVRNQVTSLMKKLDVERRAQAAAFYVKAIS